MEKYILKPLQVQITSDIKELSNKVIENPKLRICEGDTKNGKTALSFKLLHSILEQQEIFCNPMMIGFDLKKVYKYWFQRLDNDIQDNYIKSKFKGLPIVYPLLSNENNEILETLKTTINNAINKYSSNFIIVDGFDSCLNTLNIEAIFNFIEYLATLVKNLGINVLLSSRNEYAFLKDKDANEFIERWILKRPTYIGGDIKEFGDSRLIVLNQNIDIKGIRETIKPSAQTIFKRSLNELWNNILDRSSSAELAELTNILQDFENNQLNSIQDQEIIERILEEDYELLKKLAE